MRCEGASAWAEGREARILPRPPHPHGAERNTSKAPHGAFLLCREYHPWEKVCDLPTRRDTLLIVSNRVQAAANSFEPIRQFYFHSRYAQRRSAPCISDFTFG